MIGLRSDKKYLKVPFFKRLLYIFVMDKKKPYKCTHQKGSTYKMSHVVKCERRRRYINRGWLVMMNKNVFRFWLPVENADPCIEQAVAPKASPNTL